MGFFHCVTLLLDCLCGRFNVYSFDTNHYKRETMFRNFRKFMSMNNGFNVAKKNTEITCFLLSYNG